jgi:hypothetical protein
MPCHWYIRNNDWTKNGLGDKTTASSSLCVIIQSLSIQRGIQCALREDIKNLCMLLCMWFQLTFIPIHGPTKWVNYQLSITASCLLFFLRHISYDRGVRLHKMIGLCIFGLWLERKNGTWQNGGAMHDS